MQTMEHAIARPRGMTPQRVTGLVAAGLLQATLIWALIEGLNVKIWPTPVPHTEIRVIQDKIKSTPLPQPPDVTLQQPTQVTAQEPTFHFDDGTPYDQAITTVRGPANPYVDYAATTVSGTHTTPPYPPLAIRLGEEGTVQLHLTISPQGTVVAADVMRSSGYDDLDRAAQDWIMAHWRYHPAMRGGVATASEGTVQVRFDLKNAH